MINKDPDKQTNVLPVQYKVYPQRWWILGKVSYKIGDSIRTKYSD